MEDDIFTTATHSRQKYWAFFQHCLSTETICLHKMLLIFLTRATSDSTFLNFMLRFFISLVSEIITILLCFCNFKNRVLLDALSVPSVYIAVKSLPNVAMTEWLNEKFTFSSPVLLTKTHLHLSAGMIEYAKIELLIGGF